MKHNCVNLQLKREATGYISMKAHLTHSHLHTHLRVFVHCGCIIFLLRKHSVCLRNLYPFQIVNLSLIRPAVLPEHTKCCPPPFSSSVELGAGVQRCLWCLQQREAEIFMSLAGHFDFHIKLVSYSMTLEESQTSRTSVEAMWTQIFTTL